MVCSYVKPKVYGEKGEFLGFVYFLFWLHAGAVSLPPLGPDVISLV
jgi:hypothetical protein